MSVLGRDGSFFDPYSQLPLQFAGYSPTPHRGHGERGGLGEDKSSRKCGVLVDYDMKRSLRV